MTRRMAKTSSPKAPRGGAGGERTTEEKDGCGISVKVPSLTKTGDVSACSSAAEGRGDIGIIDKKSLIQVSRAEPLYGVSLALAYGCLAAGDPTARAGAGPRLARDRRRIQDS